MNKQYTMAGSAVIGVLLAAILIGVPGCTDDTAITGSGEEALQESALTNYLDAAATYEYEATRLELPYGAVSSDLFQTSINENGQFPLQSGGNAYLWDPETGKQQLKNLNGLDCQGHDINNSGSVVGSCRVGPESYEWIPVVWHLPENVQELSLPDNSNYGRVWSINDDGQIAGYIRDEYNFTYSAIWEKDSTMPVVFDDYLNGSLESINNHGDAVGSYEDKDEVRRAFVWFQDEEEFHVLEDADLALRINDDRDIILNIADMKYLWVYKGGNNWHPIGTALESVDLTNRNNGIINYTGYSTSSRNDLGRVDSWDVESNEGIEWRGSQVLPLPDEIHHRQGSARAYAINSKGWIAGISYDHNQPQKVTLWKPVDAPDNGNNGEDDDDEEEEENGDDDDEEEDEEHCPPGHQRQERC